MGARSASFCYESSMKSRRVSKRLTDNARALRNQATPQERALWALLSHFRPKFTHRLSLDPYWIGDLACRQARLIVEIDGSQHIDAASDEVRTRFIESEGWTVIRFWNSEVDENPEGVVEAILQKATECLGGMRPEAVPSRAGRLRRPRFPD